MIKMNMCQVSFYDITRVFWRLKCKFYNTKIRIMMFYGLKCWDVEKSFTFELSVVEWRILMHHLGTPWEVTFWES